MKVINWRTIVSMIRHDISFLNHAIEQNQYFFIDILKEGIMLFDSGKLVYPSQKN